MFEQKRTDIEPVFGGLSVPEPVFYCSIESPSLSKLKDLELALAHLQREDPSFKVLSDKESGQTVIKGMGELHIEVQYLCYYSSRNIHQITAQLIP
jgi:elongation factor G